MAGKFGVSSFIDEIYIEAFEKENTYTSPEFQYVVEIVDCVDVNGNGYDLMKIYTNGELELISMGNWKVSPIIKMPFNWSGFSVEIEMSDNNNEIVVIKHKPTDHSIYKKVDFIPDIKYVIETIKKFMLIEDKRHFDLIGQIEQVDGEYRFLKSILGINEIQLDRLGKICRMIEDVIKEFKNQETRLKPEYNENIKKELNRLLMTLSDFKIKLIE